MTIWEAYSGKLAPPLFKTKGENTNDTRDYYLY